jgi:signal transduction histidine kinase
MVRRFVTSYGELALVFALGALAQVELWLDSHWASDRHELAPLAVAMAALLLLRLRSPLLTLVLLVAAFELEAVLLKSPGDDPMSLVLILLVGLYSAGAHTRGRTLAAATLVAAAAVVTGMIEDGDSLNISGFLFFAFFIGAPLLAGAVIRLRREREHVLVGERDESARAAVAEERARIARELHDVVAHAISVIVLQARGARHTEGAERDAALEAIESTGATALTEMRRLLHMLRADDEDVSLAPQPSLAHLELLVSQVRDAGLPVELRIEGERRELPPGVDVSAYRIVQEALTNALKHAGPAKARVSVRFSQDALELTIADTGAGATNGGGGGHGLVGMRERVAAFGGDLASGPAQDGGFAVRARLPL